MYFRYKTVFFITALITFSINASQDNNDKSIEPKDITENIDNRLQVKQIFADIIPLKEIRNIIALYYFDITQDSKFDSKWVQNVYPSQVAFSNNGKYLAKISSWQENDYESKGELCLFCTKNKCEEFITRRYHFYLDACIFSPDDKYLAIAGNDSLNNGKIIILDIAEDSKVFGSILRYFTGHVFFINSIFFSKEINPYCLISGSTNGQIKTWNFDAKLPKQTDEDMLLDAWMATKIRPIVNVKAMAYSIVKSLLAIGLENEIKIVDLNLGRRDKKNITGIEKLNSLKFLPNGKFLAAGDVVYIKIWDTENYKLLHSIQASGDYHISSIDFSKDNKFFAAGFQDGKIKIFDTKNFTHLLELKGHNPNLSVRSLAFSSTIENIQYLASSAHLIYHTLLKLDGELSIWRVDELDLD